MKTQRLGRSSFEVSRLAYGCMRLTGHWARDRVTEEDIRRGIGMVEAAFEAGYNFFDHADIYGDSMCEIIFGRALALHPGWRARMFIATKCGIRWADQPKPGDPFRYDLSYRYIVDSAEGSLRRLGIETIDLLQLHRPDYLADPHEIARAFVELREAGKVREFGVSNFRPSLLAAVQRALPFPLQVNQVEIHLNRLDCFTDGTLDQCLELGMTPLAWSPLDRGKLATGAPPDVIEPDQQRRLKLLLALDAAAQHCEVSRTVIALAWLLRHPARIIPIVGSANPDNIRAAVRADELELDRETWYKLLEAAVGQRLP
jgi:predicted oxidoreductase